MEPQKERLVVTYPEDDKAGLGSQIIRFQILDSLDSRGCYVPSHLTGPIPQNLII